MKKLILLLTLASISCQAQELKTITMNLGKCHEQYSNGTGFVVAGAVLTSVGLYMTRKETVQTKTEKLARSIYLIGAASISIGFVIQIDSHKFIKRASE